MARAIGFGLMLLGVTGSAFASFATPEIDASTGPAAVALLSGGLLMLRTRRKK